MSRINEMCYNGLAENTLFENFIDKKAAAIRAGWHDWLFWIALSNCLIDFILTAPLYTGFPECGAGKK